MQNPEEVIRKLLALSNSSNENEAMLAAEKASLLALKYNIDLLALQQKSDIQYDNQDLTHDLNVEQWISNILSGVANLNAVKHYRTLNPITQDWHYRLVGRPHNISITRSITLYLVNEVRRLNTIHVKQHIHLNTSSARAAYRKAFRLSASQRIYSRLTEKKAAINRSNNSCLQLTTHSHLVVADYFKTEAAACDEFIKQTVGALTTSRPRSLTVRSTEGLVDGQKAGNAISLNTQLNGGQHGTRRINQQ